MSPLAVLTKLAVVLRSVPAVRLVFAKFEALLRNKESGEPLASEFLGEASGATINTLDQHAAVLQPSSDQAIAVTETNDQSEREKLIRRRWTETGIKMWNPDVRGAGHAALADLWRRIFRVSTRRKTDCGENDQRPHRYFPFAFSPICVACCY
jgi:hypothetical protein